MTKVLNVVSSAKLAAACILIVMLLAFAGIVLPQHGVVDSAAISVWQEEHHILAGLASPFGLFHVFRSWTFMFVIAVLFLNILCCTVMRFCGPERKRLDFQSVGSATLHIAILTLLVGGLMSAAGRFDGRIVLTEGQPFSGDRNAYVSFTEGPLRNDGKLVVPFVLDGVRTEHVGEKYYTGVFSTLRIQGSEKKHVVSMNRPWHYGGFAFTHLQTGFSPKLTIRETRTGGLLSAAFVALTTFESGRSREYRDFIHLPTGTGKILLTLYPDGELEEGEVVVRGDELRDPILHLEWQDAAENVTATTFLRLGELSQREGISLEFEDLRRWSSFRVMDDPGYPLVVVSLWLGLFALLVRYMPELIIWFKE